jgi:hypothetical protein
VHVSNFVWANQKKIFSSSVFVHGVQFKCNKMMWLLFSFDGVAVAIFLEENKKYM